MPTATRIALTWPPVTVMPIQSETAGRNERSANSRWLVGSGPEGQVYEVKTDVAAGTYTSQTVIKLEDAQVYALKVLPGGGFLAGTSPKGGLVLVKTAAKGGVQQ